jgi:vacuolar-type H+-ATPase subunit F/Vma7
MVAFLVGAAVVYLVLHRRAGWVDIWKFTEGHIRPFYDLIPLEEITHKLYVLTDESVVAGFRITGVATDLRGSEDVVMRVERLASAFNSLEEGCEAIIRIRRIKDSGPILKAFDEASKPRTAALLFIKRVWRRQLEYFATHPTAPFLDTQIHVFLRVAPEKRGAGVVRLVGDIVSSVAGKKLDAVQEAAEARANFATRLRFFEERARSFVSALQNAGFAPEQLDNLGLDRYAASCLWSPERFARYQPSRRPEPNHFVFAGVSPATRKVILSQDPRAADYYPQTTRAQLGSVAYEAKPDYVVIDGRIMGVMRMFMAPSHADPEMLRYFRESLPFECTYTIRASARSKQAEIKRLKKAADAAERANRQNAFSPREDVGNRMASTEKQERHEALLADSAARPFGVEITLTFPAESQDDLKKKQIQVQQYFSEVNDSRMVPETVSADRYFREALPFVVANNKNPRLVLFTHEVVALSPVFEPWKGSKKPVRVFKTRSGEPFGYDPFDWDLLNRNRIFTGVTGSGKGFNGQEIDIIPALVRGDVDVCIADSAGTYKPLCNIVGGTYYEASHGSKQGFNSFYIPPTYFALKEEDRREFLAAHVGGNTNLVLTLVMPRPDEEADFSAIIQEVVNDALQESERAMGAAISHDEDPVQYEVLLGDVRERFRRYTNPDAPRYEGIAKDIVTRLKPYVRCRLTGQVGANAPLFDTPNSVDLKKPLVVVDFFRVQNMGPTLVTAYLISVICGAFTQKALLNSTSSEGRGTYWLFDECAELLPNVRFAREVVRGYRQARRLGLAVNTMFQGYPDLSLPEFAEFGGPIKQAAGTVWFLMHAKDEATAKAFRENNLAVVGERAMSLTTDPGRYGEAIMRQRRTNPTNGTSEEMFADIGVYPIPVQLWWESSNPRDKTARTRMAERFGPGTRFGLSHFEMAYALGAIFPEGAVRGSPFPDVTVDRFPDDDIIVGLAQEARREFRECESQILAGVGEDPRWAGSDNVAPTDIEDADVNETVIPWPEPYERLALTAGEPRTESPDYEIESDVANVTVMNESSESIQTHDVAAWGVASVNPGQQRHASADEVVVLETTDRESVADSVVAHAAPPRRRARVSTVTSEDS